MWRLRSRLFEHIIHQEVGFFDRVRTGELMNRLSEVRALDACTPLSCAKNWLTSSCISKLRFHSNPHAVWS